MNKREAKVEAYGIAAAAVERAIGTGLIDPALDDADSGRIEDALNEIVKSLRGSGDRMRYRYSGALKW